MTTNDATGIVWDDALKRGIAFQDADHAEAVAQINAMQTCADADLPRLFAEHLAHVRAHFAREHEMMARTAFFATDCHAAEHMRVIRELQEVQARLDAGDLKAARSYVTTTLPQWFLNHLSTMDTVTAEHARSRGES